MKTLDIVHVVWRDALGSPVAWENLDELDKDLKYERDIMETVGFLIYRDKRYITVGGGIHYDSWGNPCKAHSVFSIPTRSIIHVRKISGPIKRKS